MLPLRTAKRIRTLQAHVWREGSLDRYRNKGKHALGPPQNVCVEYMPLLPVGRIVTRMRRGVRCAGSVRFCRWTWRHEKLRRSPCPQGANCPSTLQIRRDRRFLEMRVEVDHTSQPRVQDGGGQVFWTIGSDHRLYRIELSDRGAIAVAAEHGAAGSVAGAGRPAVGSRPAG
jgi:hypothetical protein